MISTSRIIAGIFGVILGTLMIIAGIFLSWVLSIYGMIFLVIGLIIFLNPSEDKIEQIKPRKSIKSKKTSK